MFIVSCVVDHVCVFPIQFLMMSMNVWGIYWTLYTRSYEEQKPTDGAGVQYGTYVNNER